MARDISCSYPRDTRPSLDITYVYGRAYAANCVRESQGTRLRGQAVAPRQIDCGRHTKLARIIHVEWDTRA
jgi:hypothetical protein